MKRTALPILISILFFYSSPALPLQNGNGSHRDHLIDSLKSVLTSLTKGDKLQPTLQGQSLGIDIDTLRIKALNNLAWELKHVNTDTAVLLSTEALTLAQSHYNYTSTSKEDQKKVRNTIHKLIGKSYVQLGAFYKIKDEYPLALDYNFKALALFKELEKDTALNTISTILERKSVILGNIGAIYTDMGDYPKALESHFEALKASELIGNKSLIAGKLINIGNVYHFKNDHQKALEYQSKALKIAEEINDRNKIATSLSNIGIAYKYLREYDKALANHLRALEIDKTLENDDDIARHYINIAGVYYDKGDYENVLDNDVKALEVYQKLKSKSGIATSLGNIGSTQILLKKYTEAEKNLQQALAISTEINALSLIKDHEQFLYELYEKSGQPAKALEHFKKYTAIKDSIFNEENTKKTVRSEMNFEFEKKQAIAKAEQDKLNAIAEEEKQKQKIILIAVSVFLLLVIVFSVFMYNRWRITQKQKAIIEKQKEKIVDSINYAQFIQESILIEEEDIRKHLPGAFIYFKPKDIVSGDFYWFSKLTSRSESGVKSLNEPEAVSRELIIIAAVDCTGHGVPGAFMSMIGNTLLNQIVNEKRITTPSEILYHLNLGIYEALHQKKGASMSRDGMDIALCSIDLQNKQLQYAGAKNPLYILKDSELNTITSTNKSIGGGLTLKPQNPLETRFENHTLPIEPDMSIYIFSDGFKDQFGAEGRQKFGSQKFKELLGTAATLSPEKQKELLSFTQTKWQGQTPQTDDILVVGIKF